MPLEKYQSEFLQVLEFGNLDFGWNVMYQLPLESLPQAVAIITFVNIIVNYSFWCYCPHLDRVCIIVRSPAKPMGGHCPTSIIWWAWVVYLCDRLQKQINFCNLKSDRLTYPDYRTRVVLCICTNFSLLSTLWRHQIN